MLGLGLGLHGIEKASGEYAGGVPSLIIPSADIPELELYLTAEEYDLADGAALTAPTDQTGKVSGITISGVTLNIAANGDKEFDFGTALAHINIGDPPNLDFTPSVDEFTVLVVTGETLGAAGTTWVHKGDRAIGVGEFSMFYSGVSAMFCFAWGIGLSGSFTSPTPWSPKDVATITIADDGVGTSWTAYRNGTLMGGGNPKYTGALTKRTGQPWIIGAEQSGASFLASSDLTGTLKAVMIFSKVLSQTEIANIVAEL